MKVYWPLNQFVDQTRYLMLECFVACIGPLIVLKAENLQPFATREGVLIKIKWKFQTLHVWTYALRNYHKRFIPQRTSCEFWKSDRQTPRYCLTKSEQSRETPLHLCIHKLLLWIKASRLRHKSFISQKTSCKSWKSDRHAEILFDKVWAWPCHHVMRVDLSEQKFPVDPSSPEGGP